MVAFFLGDLLGGAVGAGVAFFLGDLLGAAAGAAFFLGGALGVVVAGATFFLGGAVPTSAVHGDGLFLVGAAVVDEAEACDLFGCI